MTGWLLMALAVFAVARRGPGAGGERAFTTMLAYTLDPEVRFAVSSGEDQVKLVTWLATTDAWPEDVRVTSPYALDVRLEGPGGELLREQRVWVTTRRSSVEDESGVLAPTAWLAEGDARLSEERLVLVDLKGLVPAGGRVIVRPGDVPEGARVLLVAFHRGERDALARVRLDHGDGAAFREEAAEDLAAPEWDALPATWRANLTERVWERLGALPVAGGVVPTTRVFSTFEHAEWSRAPADGILLPPGGAAAWNVMGRVTFAAEWRDAYGGPASGVDGYARIVHADGSVEARPLPAGGRIGPWSFDEPLVSVQIALADDEVPRRISARTTSAAPDRSWGDPPRPAPDAEGVQEVGPDLRSIELYRVGGGLAPLRFVVERGEVVRLHVRPRLPAGPLPAFAPPVAEAPRAVHLEARDATGRLLQQWDDEVAAVPSPFERYTQVDTPASARVSVGEARTLVLPIGTTTLFVTASDLVDVTLRVAEPVDLAEQVEPGYALPPDATVETLFVPRARDGWRARAPQDIEALAAADRVVRVDAQVRLAPDADAEVGGTDGPDVPEPGDVSAVSGVSDVSDVSGVSGVSGVSDVSDVTGASVGGVPTRPWWPLPLSGPFQFVAEASTAPAPEGNAPGARVRLGAEPTPVTVPPDGRLRVDYRVPVSEVGTAAHLRLGDEERVVPLQTAAGALELGGLPPGPLTVAADTPGLFLARSPGAPAWRVRRVWPLVAGRVITVDLPGGEGAIGLHVYLPEGESGWISWTLEDVADSPPGIYTRITDRRGFVPLQPSARTADPLSFSEEPLVLAAPVRVRLGDDVGRGRGRLTVSLEGTAASGWIRATSTWPDAEDEGVHHWTRGTPN